MVFMGLIEWRAKRRGNARRARARQHDAQLR
jgi:hypothetical protein